MSAINRNRILCIAVVLCTTSTASAWAQYGGGMPMARPGRQNQPSKRDMQTPFQGTAVIQAVGSRGLEVNAEGATWLVAPDKNCKIEVTGTADPSFLNYVRSPLLVKFNAEFDKKGKATAAVNELEIVSPQTAMTQMRKDSADGSSKGLADGSNGSILGHLTAYKNNQMTVETPSGTYTAELGANPAIKVNVATFQWAQPGDKVDVRGYYEKQGAAVAQEMRVTLSNPLGDTPKKKPAAKPAAAK